MKRKLFRWCLAVALIATLAAAVFAPPSADDGVVLAEHVRSRAISRPTSVDDGRTSRPGSGVSSLRVLSIHSRTVAEGGGEDSDDEHERATRGFSAIQWAPPAQRQVLPASPPPAPPPLQAPPLPFQFMGKYVEGNQVAIFLKHNDQSVVARVGDVIANYYKVEGLQGGTLTLVYLPLNQTQTLDIGGKN